MGIYLFFVMFTSNFYILKCDVHTLNLDFVDGDVSTWSNYQTRVANRSDFRFHTQPLIFTCICSSKCRRRPPLTLLSWMLERTPSTKFHGKLLSKVRLVFVFYLSPRWMTNETSFSAEISTASPWSFSRLVDWLILRLLKSRDRTLSDYPWMAIQVGDQPFAVPEVQEITKPSLFTPCAWFSLFVKRLTHHR